LTAIWLSPTEILALPASGPPFIAVKAAADKADWGLANVRDSTYAHNINCLAGALMTVRLGDDKYATKTAAELRKLIGTENGGKLGGQVPVLAVGRKLGSYVVAADLIGFREPGWVQWLTALRTKQLQDSSGFGGSLVGCHEKRPNNFGTHAGWSRIAADVYLGSADLAHAVQVLRGWLGDRASYAGFKWTDTNWHADPVAERGVNAKGVMRLGHPIGGVLPEDQRRAGSFTWPPPCENYVRGALGPVFSSLWVLGRNGYADASGWSDSAARRAAEWYVAQGCSFTGDDGWQPFLIRKLYPGVAVPGGSVTAKGKSMSWAGWTHA